jgi:hypothetical protein
MRIKRANATPTKEPSRIMKYCSWTPESAHPYIFTITYPVIGVSLCVP